MITFRLNTPKLETFSAILCFRDGEEVTVASLTKEERALYVAERRRIADAKSELPEMVASCERAARMGAAFYKSMNQ